eukprot:g17658.t2
MRAPSQQQQRGQPRPATKSSRNSTHGRRGTDGAVSEANAKKLHETLREAEARQTASWVQAQHQAINHELTLTASRLERADSLGSEPPNTFFWDGNSVSDPDFADEHHKDGLASTWPAGGSSSLRVDGHGLRLSHTAPSKRLGGGRAYAERVAHGKKTAARKKRAAAEALVERVRSAMESQGVDAMALKEFILPSSTADPEDIYPPVRSWEVFKVLDVDLGLQLSEDDKQLVSARFGDGEDGGRVDVQALLIALGLEQTGNLATDLVVQSNGTTEERSSADEEQSAHQRAIGDDDTNGVSESVDQGAGNGGGGNDRAEDTAARDHAATVVEEENARLRSELAVFDLGFFEEVEDLKYSYATLKREAEKLAKKQGVDLGASLGLPEDGEEPWDRTVDMAHHSVDWAETTRRRPPGSPSSPPRGAHAARLARQWNKLSSEFGGDEKGESEGNMQLPVGSPARGNEGPARGIRPISIFSAQRSAGRGKQPIASRPWDGFIAAHERKLAWELSTGGMDSLACLRESIGRVGRHGGGFGSDEEVFSALRQSGYALEVQDVAVLRTGLGSSADGKVDLEEFTTLCEDIASGEEWYVPAAPAVGAAAALPPAVAMISRAPEAWNGAASRMDGFLPAGLHIQEGGRAPGGATVGGFDSPATQLRGAANDRFGASAGGFGPVNALASPGLARAEPRYLGGTFFGDKSYLEPSKTAEQVLAELKDQLKLLDTDRFFPPPVATKSGMDGVRAAGARDAGAGAVTLGQAVGVKFSRRDPSQSGLLSARELGLALEDVGVSLHPDEVVALSKKFKPPGESPQQVGEDRVLRPGGIFATTVFLDNGELDAVVAEYAPLVRVIVDCLAEVSGIDPAVGGRARLGQGGMKWNERMPAPAKRLRAALTAGAEGGGWLERVRQRFRDFDIDGDGCLGRREFVRALNLALACETGESSDPSPDFTVGGVMSEQEATELMVRLDRDRDGRVCWEAFVEYFAGVEGATGGHGRAPETWFQREGDIAEKLIQHMEVQGGLVARRAWVNTLRRRFQTADSHGIGALEREDFVRCLRGMRIGLSVREGERLFLALLPTTTDADGARYPELVDFLRSNNAKWYEVERGIADKILAAMGADSPSRRAWLNRMRRRFMSFDAFRVGVLGASDLLQALRDGGCYLGLEEEARLLDALETEESARFDTEGGVSYRELLLFCARHAGKWNDAEPELAEKLREALRSQAKTAADVRRLFRRLDDDGDGLIGRKDFKIALHRLGLGFLTREEQEVLMDALDGEGSGRVRYADFSSFFMDADPWFERDTNLAERLCQSLENSGVDGSGPGTVLATLRERFVAADSKKGGFLDAAQFRAVLADLPGTAGLTEDEVERLTTLLDEEGDGRVRYRSLLGMLIKHLGDWAKRLPEVASELSLALHDTQYGLKACVENLSRRLDIADYSGAGRLSPSALGRCLRSVGLILAPDSLQHMVAVMDAHGDGLIPTEPVLKFLRKEAGLASSPPPLHEGNMQQAGGKVGAAFRDAVLSLAKAEQEYARLDDGGGDGYDSVAFDAAVNGAARKGTTQGGRRRSLSSGEGIDDEAGVWATLPWRTCLRRVFDRRLDLDGDGYLTEGDLIACLPEIGVDVESRGTPRALLVAMDSRDRGLGQATFRDFVEFMGGESRGAAQFRRGGDRCASPKRDGSAEKVTLEPSQKALVRQIRLALGLPLTAINQTSEDSDAVITEKDLRQALTRMDPRGSGRLPLGKIKAALQGLGLEVGRVPRASWLDLTGSLDQDVYGDIFYSDFVDLLMAPSPTPSSPSVESNRERVRNALTSRATSAGPEAIGIRTRKKNGAYSDDETGNNNGVSDESIDGWRARTYSAAGSSSQNRHRTQGPLARRAQSIRGESPFGRGRSPPPVAGHANGYNESSHGFSRGGRAKRASPSVDTRRRAGGEGRSTGEQSRWQLGNRRPSWRSPDRVAGDSNVSATRRGRERGRSVDGGASRQGSSAALDSLAERILDGVFDEHGGAAEGGRALRSALRRQDLTRSGRLSQGEFRRALEIAGAPLLPKEVAVLFEHFDKRVSGVLDYGRFTDWILQWHSLEKAPSSSVDGLAASVQRTLRAQGPEVNSIRRRLQDDLAKGREAVIGGIEFKRLLRSSGLDLKPVEISYLRQKCGDASGQVNALALLAYLGPPELVNRNGGNGELLLPSTVLRGQAHERHERPKSASSAGLGCGAEVDTGNEKAQIRGRVAADLRRKHARERQRNHYSQIATTERTLALHEDQ